MKKTILIVLITILSVQLAAIIIDLDDSGNSKAEVAISDLVGMPQTTLTTEKVKDGQTVKTDWKGVELKHLITEMKINDFESLAFSSADNYLVRLTKEDIKTNQAIVALYKDDETGEMSTRLVVPEKSAMFWIRDIALIKVERKSRQAIPRIIYLAENILAEIPIIENPKPFVDVKGYYFREVISELYPNVRGEFRLIAKDGTEHTLDFSNYLKDAVLVRSETGYILQSPQMPGGMWIKNIAYIQKDETAIVFRLQMDSWEAVKDLAEWGKLPAELNHRNKKFSTKTSLNNPSWIGISKLTW